MATINEKTPNTKMTYALALEAVLALPAGTLSPEVIEKLTALRATYDRKASAERKPTKNQLANVTLAEIVLNTLRELGKPSTVTEVFQLLEVPEIQSPQKVSALMRQLLLEGKVVKTAEKRTSLFSAV